jgi:hypothetical protein
MSSEYYFAAPFLLGTFLWLDILTSVSPRGKPSLKLNHELLLEGADIELGRVFGCENWALFLIFKISALNNWKKDCEENQAEHCRAC